MATLASVAAGVGGTEPLTDGLGSDPDEIGGEPWDTLSATTATTNPLATIARPIETRERRKAAKA